jgi:predicted DNA-binding transcriptional regulator YafY
MTKTERWLSLLAFLLAHRYPVTREEILSQVDDYRADWTSGDETRRESARRKFERDKRELRELGVVLETAAVEPEHAEQPVEGYRLRPEDFYLPYLEVQVGGRRLPRPYDLPSVRLEPAELAVLRRAAERVARLAGTPLAGAAQAVVRKLAFDVPELARAAPEQTLLEPTPPEFARHFAVVKRGLEERRAVRCRYYAIGRDREEERVIEPYGLMLTWGHWYCVAHSRERRALRVFRLDRLRDAELVAGAAGAFAVPRTFTIAAYLNRAPWELSDDPPVTARVRIAFPQSRWVVAEGLGKVTTPVTDDGGAELEFAVRVPDAFVRWLLPFGAQAEVLEPPALQRRLARARAALRRLYR